MYRLGFFFPHPHFHIFPHFAAIFFIFSIERAPVAGRLIHLAAASADAWSEWGGAGGRRAQGPGLWLVE